MASIPPARRYAPQASRKWISFFLLGGMALLALELRYEHRDVLGEQPISWVPIVYSLLMFVLGLVALAAWDRGGRKFLLAGFAAAVIVGAVGFWEHNAHHMGQRIATVAGAWALPVRKGDDAKPGGGDQGARNAAPAAVGAAASNERRGGGDQDGDGSAPKSQSTAAAAAGTTGTTGGTGVRGAGGGRDPLRGRPVFAPLTFAGLGLIGIFACAGAAVPAVEQRAAAR